MSVGLGIFLASVVIALVVLYGITKDRWSWRQIARLCALIIAALVVLAGAVIGGVYFWSRLPAITSPQTEYAGIRLGVGPDEVLYIKGYPEEVLGEMIGGEWPGFKLVIVTKDLEKGKDVHDYQDWIYEGSLNRIEVTLNAEKTAVAVINCYSNDSQRRCPSILGVTDGDSEQEVIRKLGAPGTSQITGVTKFISYPNAGIHLWLTKERVYLLGINDRKYKYKLDR
jgi:hypothetical protein